MDDIFGLTERVLVLRVDQRHRKLERYILLVGFVDMGVSRAWRWRLTKVFEVW